MTTRRELVDWARRQVGSNDRVGYWVKALGSDPGKSKHWCGAFFLAGLHEVGLALHHKWGIDGTGLQALRLPLVARPEPGDMGYDHTPYQHHFLVEDVGEHTYTSIDGNQGSPGVQRRTRAFKTTGVTFYSIAPLLRQTDPAPPSWNDETQPTGPIRPVLRLRATGEHVSYLQSKLAPLFPGVVVDGSFGPQTAATVMGFQRRAGLDADGVVGPATWAALEKT